MELKDFIKETLTQITLGVKEAQELTKDHGVIINPDKVGTGSKGDKYLRNDGWRFVQDIEINVAVTVNEREGSKGGIGVVAGLFSAGGSISEDQENSTVSTIKFVVPVALPTVDTPDHYISHKISVG
jgi:hypothetical protein